MRAAIPYLFITFFILLLFPSFFYLAPGEGLDSSYNIAISLAYKYNLVFGKDFVFTFGPLGILNNRFPISVSRWVYLLSDVYFLGTLFFILKDIFKKHFSYPLVIFVFLSITVAFRDSMFQRYFYCFLFYLFAVIKEPRKMENIVQAALLSILCFYYKLNLGIPAIVFFWMAISYTFIRKKMSGKVYSGVAGSYILFMLTSAWLLHVNLKGYVLGGLQLIDAFNDAMSLPAGGAYIIFLFEAVLIVLIITGRGLYLLAAAIRKKEVAKNADDLFIHGGPGFNGFVPTIKMKNSYYTFPEKPEAERRADSMGVLGIITEFNKYKPTLIDPSLYKTDSFSCWIDYSKTYSPLIRLGGWAYRESSGNENSVAGVILRSEDKVYELPSEKQNRMDIAQYYRRKSMTVPGFTARVSKSGLPAGVYQIGVTLSDTVSREKWIYFTDRQIQIR